ncbi:tape measure protein [Pseudomonas sp. D(2018)]|uniref:tape measure protein n=1 Tax=Pseudomonas sp. D(2018) TaxID=2502238 RepID=UPI0010F77D1C|nr:tape measure protein [Pseudomonas sp. D(2018)]
MLEKEISRLYGTLAFRVEQSGLQRFQVLLNQVQQRMLALGQQAKELEKKLGIAPKLNMRQQIAQQQKLTREQFQSLLQQSRLQAVQQQTALKIDALHAKLTEAQAKAAERQHKAALASAKVTAQNQRMSGQSLKLDELQVKLQERLHRAQLAHNKALAQEQRNSQQQQRFSLQAEAQRLRIAQEAQKFQTRQHQAHAAASRARVAALRAEQALERGNRRIQHKLQPLATRLGVFGHAGAGGGIGAGIGGMLSGFSAAQGAALGLAAAFGAAVIGLKSFTDKAVEAGGKGAARQSQYNAIFNNDKAKIEAADSRFLGLADFLGMNAQELSPSYTSSLQNMTDAGMTADKSQDFLGGLLKFAKGNNVSTDSQNLILRAVGQTLSKGQLYAEEWRSQIAESLPGANRLGALAYQDAIGGKLSGQKAAAKLSKDMEDGLIKGDVLLKFLDALGKRLEKEANRGGKLDTARNSHESFLNRRTNALNAAYEKAYKYNDGELAKSRTRLDKSMLELIKQATPFIERMGSAGAKLLDSMDGTVNVVAELLAYFNGKENAFSDFLSPEDAERLRGILTEVVTLARNLGVLVGDIANGWKLIFTEMEKAGVFDTMAKNLQDSLNAVNKILEGLHLIAEGKWEIGFKMTLDAFKESPANLVNNHVEAAKANPGTSLAERLGRSEWAQEMFGGNLVIQKMEETEKDLLSKKFMQRIESLSKPMPNAELPTWLQYSIQPQPTPLLPPAPTTNNTTQNIHLGGVHVTVQGNADNPDQLAKAFEKQTVGILQRQFQGLATWNPEVE